MTNTKHATTNYRALAPFLAAVEASPEKHRRFISGGYMPLSVERLYNTEGGTVYAVAHYGEQNGDLMCDPDMTIKVNAAAGTVEPLTFQNDYMGLYLSVYGETEDGRQFYRPQLRRDLDRFLWEWLSNIALQGFAPEVFEPDEITA